MKIKMTNIEGFRKLEELEKLRRLDVTLPVVAGYRIVQNTQAFSRALAPYQEMRDAIIKRYAKDGTSISKDEDPEGFERCIAELEKIDQIEIEVEIERIPVSILENKSLPLETVFMMDIMLEKSMGKGGC